MVREAKMKSGIIWSFIGGYGSKFISTFVFFLLAKLLGAEQFGLVGIANAIISFGDLIIEQGMVSAIVQKENPKPSYLNTAFWVNLILGATVFLIFILCAPVIAMLFKEPRLSDILRVASLVYLIGPCAIVQTAILTKQMNFQAITISRSIGLAVSGVLAIGLAFWGFEAWTLVFQQLVFVSVSTVLLWKHSDWRPSFSFSKESFYEIFSFSSKILGFNFIDYFNKSSTELTIGLFLNAQAVGLYLFAYKIFHTTLHIANASINQVMLPLFSSVQDDDATLAKYFLKAVKTAYFVLFPILIFVIFIAPLAIEKLFNSSWDNGIDLISWICIAGILNMICYYVNSLLISKNRLNLLLKLNVIAGLLNIVFVYFSAQISLEAVGISQIIKNIVILPISYYFLSKVIYISLKDLGSSLVNQFFICIFMLFVMLSISYVDFINNLDAYFLLIVRCIVFSLALFASFSIFAPEISRVVKAKLYQIYK
jgi:O-antigen/teichoic acid export membrane protein